VSTQRVNRIRSLGSLLASFSGAAVIAACAASVEQRSNLPNADKMAEIHAGATTKNEVVTILGTPSSVSVFNNDKSWYYISRRTAQTAFFDPDVVDQQVYVVSFDDQGVVKAVDHKVLQDGVEVTPVARATPAPGRELSFLEQLLGNLGKFNGSGSRTAGSGGGGSGTPQGPSPTDRRN
jgi:outer membrane protein assembly factor BamE (lipoprotein component of BamABCDE complex)